MRPSIYISLATWLIQQDLHRQDRQWRRNLRRRSYHVPWHNAHLLRDIGLDPQGRPLGQEMPIEQATQRRLAHLTRIVRWRMRTVS
ncbi:MULTISPECIES: DUF1127 domain-containing protein [unclassified Vibrio]|uniref:DUF1127 domain-containing protein n=1 Tax=Vibrio sp. HB236076 TaxID=3232307 RepID=A0AB39HE93_9VIBR|nr:DUF1127 domain-containing protein [Vibrio sp. HB161653]MDP5254593.1 DUF1127 domain-containing protein [Vibrio sp. HB161653]